MQNTQFGSLIAQNKDSFVYLNKNDRRMRFNNAQDPIYFCFDYVEKGGGAELAKEFVKDSSVKVGALIESKGAEMAKKYNQRYVIEQ